MEWLSELRVQRDALEREILRLERDAQRPRHLRLAAVGGKAVPDVREMTAALMLRLGIVNDALAALRDAAHQHSNAADEVHHPSRHARRPR